MNYLFSQATPPLQPVRHSDSRDSDELLFKQYQLSGQQFFRQFRRAQQKIFWVVGIGLVLLIASIVLFVKDPVPASDPTYAEQKKYYHDIASGLMGGVALCVVGLFYFIYKLQRLWMD